MPGIFRSLLTVLLAFAGLKSIAAQPSASRDDTQLWNDVQINIPLRDRVALQILAGARFGEKISIIEQGRLGVGIAADIGKGLSAGANYVAIESRGSNAEFSTEHRFTVRGTYRSPLKTIGLSHRSIYEYRARKRGDSWRYRAAVTLDKELPASWIKDARAFVTEEVFYVSTDRAFTRNRISVGISKKLTRPLTLDIYYMRQNDGTTQPGDLHVIAATWRIEL